MLTKNYRKWPWAAILFAVVCAPMIAAMLIALWRDLSLTEAQVKPAVTVQPNRVIVSTNVRADGSTCVTYFDYNRDPATVTECPAPVTKVEQK